MTTLLDHKTTLEYLAYLGYPGDSTTSALQVTKPRKLDRKKGKSSRNVFLTFVCGAAGSGKTSLLRNFAGKPYMDTYHPTKKPISVVNSVDIDGSEKYLVVSFRTKPGLLFITLFQATRVWIVIRSGDLAKLKEDRFARCDHLCPRLERHQLLFVHQQSKGECALCWPLGYWMI